MKRGLIYQLVQAFLEAKHAARQEKRAETNAANRTARATIWIAGFTCVSVAIGCVTVWILHNQMKETQAQERAYLFVSLVKTDPVVTNDGRRALRIFPQWENSGETPTVRLKVLAWCKASPELIDFRDTGGIADVIGPKQIKANGNCDFIPGQTLERKNGLIAKVTMGAKAIYSDVFSGTRHISEFCATFPVTQIYDPQADTIDMRAGEQFTYCPIHNCSDDECPAEDRK